MCFQYLPPLSAPLYMCKYTHRRIYPKSNFDSHKYKITLYSFTILITIFILLFPYWSYDSFLPNIRLEGFLFYERTVLILPGKRNWMVLLNLLNNFYFLNFYFQKNWGDISGLPNKISLLLETIFLKKDM